MVSAFKIKNTKTYNDTIIYTHHGPVVWDNKYQREKKYLAKDNNPPEIKIVFFKDGPKFKNISCYSNEGNR